jgi:cytochrome c oxidase cbb3-type subunit 3
LIVAKRPQDEALHTTGHDWDGIREYDRSTPSWWLWVFWATVVWSVGYWVLMPAWPLVADYSRGVLGYSQRQVVADQLAEARASQAQYVDRIAAMPLDAIRTDPELLEFALAAGRSAFAVNCSQCHGQGAQGAPGFPNLNDDDWMWGGTLDDIHRTVRFGIRSGHADTRESQMPAFLKDQLLDAKQVNDVTEFVLSLSNRAGDAGAASRGAAVYAQNCASCHGDAGEGKTEFGSPSLRDAIWLYGGDKASVLRTISYARRGVMPAWEGRLDAATMKEIAVYVHSLGGGK